MKPILFNTEMVRANLDDRKTNTRRCIKYKAGPNVSKPIPTNAKFVGVKCGLFTWETEDSIYSVKAPYQPGDILYIRETWHKYRIRKPLKAVPADFNETQYLYRADGEVANSDSSPFKWRPSIHMPKEAARLFLRVTKVRVERLQDITDEQIMNEGIQQWSKDGKLYKYAPADREGDYPMWPWQETPIKPRGAFVKLWDSTIKKADLPDYGWSANPWVWVIEYEKISKEEATK